MHRKVDSVGFLHRMDRDDVGVLQGGQDLSFSQEPSQQIPVARERIGQQLEGDVALELRVPARYTSPMPPAPTLARIS